MISFVFFVLLTPEAALNPCTEAQQIRTGVESPCTGILIGLTMAKAAANCKRVELPKCEAVAMKNARRCQTEKNALIVQLAATESALSRIEPEAWWERPLLASGSMAVGLVIGFLIAGAL
jgi:hypothetical protein